MASDGDEEIGDSNITSWDLNPKNGLYSVISDRISKMNADGNGYVTFEELDKLLVSQLQEVSHSAGISASCTELCITMEMKADQSGLKYKFP